jgi:undecaprenyl diphosphate synthase
MPETLSDNSISSSLRHVAIIMDGNGRWATQRRFGRIRGHREGAHRVDEIVSQAAELGIPYLTLYVFSTENWERPAREVNLLMKLLVQHLRTMDKKLVRNRVKLVTQGTLERLPLFVRAELRRVMAMTNFPTPRLTLNLCLSYGGRQEIVDAAKAFAAQCAEGRDSIEALTVEAFHQYLYQPAIPDPDLLIRTGGDFRISNFLLWQIAYAEILVLPTLWPDFRAQDFIAALSHFGERERRFGKTSEQLQSKDLPYLTPMALTSRGDSVLL